ncbi:aromatic ring-hydroxylating oxygenase subunit alpha [Acuticoccus mangrovi]|uniref:Aromatic ring-hydroxylating dioxygenase subunit alpha n=1 Tax=Acuticoccus mangrovi TaxID=2796142 RepID=A0A934IQB6_9HYPH|nr:aromatic ring-hydroxylating dioxygenase subunit alpha [Acuticoccus mangrovi]MBJ3778127.1 aromatic ring-hydroxylating dioxygenase subunit alpha [Acuticoccus mangrovi]
MTRTTDPVALNDWYVVGYAPDITADAPRRTRLLGQDIEVSRAPQGGFACREIGEDGGRTVPHVEERYGFVWVCLGTPAQDIIAIPEFSEGSDRRFLHRGRIAVPISGLRVIENFFDLSHFSFVHTGTLGGYGNAEVARYDVEFREDGTELWAVGCSFVQPKASAAVATQDTVVYYDYRIPRPFISIIYKDSLVERGRKDLIGLFIQPVEETSCVVHSFAFIFDRTNTDTDILHFYHEIFAQDRMILIHQHPQALPVSPLGEVPTISDASSVAYRRWVDQSGLEFSVLRNWTGDQMTRLGQVAGSGDAGVAA